MDRAGADHEVRDPQHLPALDGLRGIAVMMIVLLHFNLLGTGTGWFHPISVGRSCLWIGVDLFFVLSGFLITRILLRTRSDPRYFKTFYIRRSLRIFPLYYGVVAALVLLATVLSTAAPAELQILRRNQVWLWTYMVNYLQVWRGWDHAAPGANHFWSLAVEEQFYLLWPAVVFFCPRKHLFRLCVWCIALGPVIRALLWLLPNGSLAACVATPARMDTLAWGAAIAVGRTEARTNAWLVRFSAPSVWVGLGVLIAGVLVFGSWAVENPYVSILGFSVQAMAFAGVIVQLLDREKNGLRRFFSASWLRVVGKHSYAIYVFHPFVRRVLFDRYFSAEDLGRVPYLTRQVPFDVAGSLLTFVLALGSWYLYERWFLRLKDRWEYAAGAGPARSGQGRDRTPDGKGGGSDKRSCDGSEMQRTAGTR